MELLNKFDFTALQIISNNDFFAFLGNKKMEIILRNEREKITLKRLPLISKICFVNKNHILAKCLSGEYKVYSILENKWITIINKSKYKCSENYCPVALPDGNSFVDFYFFSPNKQVFVANFDNINKLSFLDYRSMYEVQLIEYDSHNDCIVVVDNNDIYIYRYSDLSLKKVISLPSDIGKVYGLISSKEAYVLISFNKQSINLININTMQSIKQFSLKDGTNLLGKPVISPEKKFIAVLFNNKTELYSLQSGYIMYTFHLEFNCSANFCDNDESILLGTFKDAFYIKINDKARDTNIVLS